MRLRNAMAGLALAALLLSNAGRAAADVITITVDEQGNGTLLNPVSGTFNLPSQVALDPGPGGLTLALTYNLLSPPGLVVGDVLIFEPGSVGTLSELIRFNPSGTMVFYSDIGEGSDSLADKGFPGAIYANNTSIFEVGPEGANGVTYIPTANQPGFVAGAAFPVTYVFRSDLSASVPEPGPLALLAVTGSLGGVVCAWKRRKATA